MKRFLVLFGMMLLLSSSFFGCDSAAEREVTVDVPVTESGKTTQIYPVKSAMVIADKLGPNGTGNLQADIEEAQAFTKSDGSYALEIHEASHYGSYVLFSKGGSISDSTGSPYAAIPMIAPKGAKNISTVTTMVALVSGLKDKIGSTVYDTEITSANGISWDVMQLAAVSEAVIDALSRTDKNNQLLSRPIITDIADQIEVLRKFATALNESANIKDDAEIVNAVRVAMTSFLADISLTDKETRLDAAGITNVVAACAQTIVAAIPNAGVIKATDVCPILENAVATSVYQIGGSYLEFSPDSANAANSVLPFPNDAVWSTGSVTLASQNTSQDAQDESLRTARQATQTEVLYSVINGLKLKGLSPNSSILIPLSSSITVNQDSMKNNLKIVNLSKLIGVIFAALKLGDPTTTPADQVKAKAFQALATLNADSWATLQTALKQYASIIYKTDFEVIQDGKFIKAIPLSPLDSGSIYLIYIKDLVNDTTDDFVDVNKIKIAAPILYKFLQSNTALTGTLAALEPLRQAYAPLYAYILKSLGLAKEDTLIMFTFTTTDKTLSLTGIKAIATYLAGGGPASLSELVNTVSTSGTLSYKAADGKSNIENEYTYINSQIPAQTGVVPGKGFVSSDLATQKQITVPYLYSGADKYSGTVVIFQHGYTRNKSDSAYFGVNYPIIAMDLPHHGDRKTTEDGGVDGKTYITSNALQNRINFYQSYFDMTVLARNLKAGLFDLNGDGVVDSNDVPSKIYFGGQSMGAITGSVFATYNIDKLDKVLLNVGGANFYSLIDNATSEEITSLVTTLGLKKNTIQYLVLNGILQMLHDPADPVYLVNSSIKDKVLIQTAYNDATVPNIANEILANKIGYLNPVYITDFAAVDPTTATQVGWYQYGMKSGLAANSIPHGFMLNPKVDATNVNCNQDYVNQAYGFAKSQINSFYSK